MRPAKEAHESIDVAARSREVVEETNDGPSKAEQRR
jgi:hypothetical protein